MTPNQIKAFRFAIDVFRDGVRMEPEIYIEDHLPGKHHHRYDKVFYEKMAAAALSAIDRMAGYVTRCEAELARLAALPSPPVRGQDDYWDYWEVDTIIECACVAEELMLYALISEAFVYLEDPDEFEESVGFSSVDELDQDRDYIHLVFEDMDFLDLFHDELDGYEDPNGPVAKRLGLKNLEFKDWFKLFGGSQPRQLVGQGS